MSPPKLRAAVVAATRNRADRLERLLASLRDQTIAPDQFEVVIVDDASDDRTPRLLEEEIARGGLQLSSLRRDRVGGAARARDEGWRRTQAPMIAFTDDDCEPDKRWLEEGLLAGGRNPGGFVQGRTLPNPAEADRLGPFSRTIKIERLDLNFNTCNIFYPRELLDRAGGFDWETFHYWAGGEDSDLAWRAMSLGASPSFCEEALAYHAVNELGPWRKLQVAARNMEGYALHPELRRATFVHRVFWKREHYYLTLAALGVALPRRLWLLRVALALPYARNLWARGRVLGGGPALAPYYVLHDAIEVGATLRAGIRHGTPMI